MKYTKFQTIILNNNFHIFLKIFTIIFFFAMDLSNNKKHNNLSNKINKNPIKIRIEN